MSFILDALKKSESERQRKSGPALYEVKVASPRSGLPPWAIAVVILLAINLMIGLWLLLHHPGTHAASAAAVPAPAATAATLVAPPANTPIPVPAAAPATAGAALTTTSAPLAAAQAPSAAATLPDTNASHADALTAEDYAPAGEPPATSAFAGHVRRGTTAGVPLYQDAAATPGTNIPQLRLDLHAYDVRSQNSWVMINMHKVHEGDTLPEGVHVDSITPDGAVLSYNGSRFLLPRD
jgi:general secretion pathway protein B